MSSSLMQGLMAGSQRKSAISLWRDSGDFFKYSNKMM